MHGSFKVIELDVWGRPLFANLVTYAMNTAMKFQSSGQPVKNEIWSPYYLAFKSIINFKVFQTKVE